MSISLILFLLSGKHFICLSILNYSFVGSCILGCMSLPFMASNISVQHLLACKVSFEKLADSLMGTSLQVTPFLLVLLRFSLCLFLKIILLLFNYTCLHSPPRSQTHLPPLLPQSAFILSMCPLQEFLKTLLPTVSFPLPSGYCQIVLNFNDSVYILFLFFFC